MHAGGAETLCEAHEVDGEVLKMLGRDSARAAATVTVTVERLDGTPVEVPALTVYTLGRAGRSNSGGRVDSGGGEDLDAEAGGSCFDLDSVSRSCHDWAENSTNPTFARARAGAEGVLRQCGAGAAAIAHAWEIIDNLKIPGGAALIDIDDGRRLDVASASGLRVTRFAFTKDARAEVDKALHAMGLTHFRTREALALASKAAACPGIEAELCVSDDPGYTTGYVASRRAGYVRIPGIKEAGSRSGGRVYFVSGGTDVGEIARYLTLAPVLISYAFKRA
jgi:6-carboxyhexanoate--CoA ligase